MIPRRVFAGAMTLGLLAVHRPGWARAPRTVHRVAHLSASSTVQTRPNFEFFLDGLRELGHEPGRNRSH